MFNREFSDDEDPCCAMCCPSPEHSVIADYYATAKYRKGLYSIMWGDIVVAACKIFLFSPMSAAFQGISVWMDYMGYATMHFCQVMIIMIAGGFECLILLSNYTGAFKAMVDSSTFYSVLFWFMVIFAAFKSIFGWLTYNVFKRAFYEAHGHMNPFRGVPRGSGSAPSMGNSGGYQRVGGGNVQRPSGFNAFTGKGTSLS